MGMVMQEPLLFNYTISENILYGKADAKNSDIDEAARIANATEFIQNNSDRAGQYAHLPASELLNELVKQ